jgi:hypothetical protein
VEAELQGRYVLRRQAPHANIDFQSEFLGWLAYPEIKWWWWPLMSLFIPIGWFLGARSVILESILAAHC